MMRSLSGVCIPAVVYSSWSNVSDRVQLFDLSDFANDNPVPFMPWPIASARVFPAVWFPRRKDLNIGTEFAKR